MASRERKRRGRGAENNIAWSDIGRAGGKFAKGVWDDSNNLQRIGMLPAPVVSDLAGIAGDIQMYMTEPEQRSLPNYLMTGASILPGMVPASARKSLRGLVADEKVAGRLKDELPNPVFTERAGNPGRVGFEFSDVDAKLNDDALLRLQYSLLDNPNAFPDGVAYANLEDVFDHPMLYKAYPEARKIKLGYMPGIAGDKMARGGKVKGADEIWLTDAGLDEDPRRTLLHEIQHWMQEKEGLQSGGNPRAIQRNVMRAAPKSRENLLNTVFGPGGEVWESTPREMSMAIYPRLSGEYESRMVAQSADLPQEVLDQVPINKRRALPAPGQDFPEVQIEDVLDASIARMLGQY